MKLVCIIGITLLVAGCSTRKAAQLSAEEARAMAVQLANAKAAELFHCQPFSHRPPARFVEGHWVWSDQQGHGVGDIGATVELADDGSTNRVDLKVLDSRLSREF